MRKLLFPAIMVALLMAFVTLPSEACEAPNTTPIDTVAEVADINTGIAVVSYLKAPDRQRASIAYPVYHYEPSGDSGPSNGYGPLPIIATVVNPTEMPDNFMDYRKDNAGVKTDTSYMEPLRRQATSLTVFRS